MKVLATLTLMALLIAPAYAGGDGRRSKRPTTTPPSSRSKKPRAPKSPEQIRARDQALLIYTLLRQSHFDGAERQILKTRQQKSYTRVRSALLDLLPAPKDIERITDAITKRPARQRAILMEWLTLQQPRTRVATPVPTPKPRITRRRGLRLY